MTTLGELYEPAMQITMKAEATAYLERLVEHRLSLQAKLTREDALAMERINLGYWAGYYDQDTRRRIEDLFECEHPIFGSIAKNGAPTPEQAFQKGLEWAKKRGVHGR